MNSVEKFVLGAVMYEPETCLYECRKVGVGKDSFEDHVARHIWMTVEHILTTGKPIDQLRVADLLRPKYPDIMRTLDDCVECVTTPTSIQAYALDLKRQERTRRSIQRMQEACIAIKGCEDPDAALATTIADLMAINLRTNIEIHKLEDLRESKVAQWKQAQESGFVGVPFCISEVNQYLGGWRPGSFAILGGFRGEGKSTLIRQDALFNAQAGRKVLLFSLEDSADIAGASIAGAHAGISTFHLDQGKAYDGVLERMDAAWKSIGDLPLWIVSAAVGITDIVSISDMLHARYKLDVIYIDHIQFIAPLVMQHNNRTGTLAHYSLTLSGLAKRLNVPVVALSQLSRDAEKDNRKPRLSDLRDSGSLEQDARAVLLLYWDSENECHQIEVAKNNYGISGRSVPAWRIDGQHRFSAVSPSQHKFAQESSQHDQA